MSNRLAKKKIKLLLLSKVFPPAEQKLSQKNYLARVPETFRIKPSCMCFAIFLPVFDIIHPVLHFRFRTGLLYLSRRETKITPTHLALS